MSGWWEDRVRNYVKYGHTPLSCKGCWFNTYKRTHPMDEMMFSISWCSIIEKEINNRIEPACTVIDFEKKLLEVI